jgi:hypothetical protein
MIFGCAQRGDTHNPLGLTGGSDGGYGKRQGYYQYGSALSQSGDGIQGVWTESENTLTINTDGTFELKSSEDIRIGTFSKEKDKLTLNFEDGFAVTYTYELKDRQLVLTEVE